MTDISPSDPASWPTFRKAALVRAIQFTEAMARGDEPAPECVRMCSRTIGPPPERQLWSHKHQIDTLEGPHLVSVGDWIAQGVKGEFWPIKPDVFAASYTPSSLAPQADAIAAALASLDALVEECAPEHVGAGVIQYKRSVHPGEVRAIADRLRAASGEGAR